MKSRIKITSIETAVKIYYTYPELGTDEVIQLFGCSKATATRMKKRARERQIREGVIIWIGRQCWLDIKKEIRNLMADKKKKANTSKIIYLRYVDVEGREIIRKKKGAD